MRRRRLFRQRGPRLGLLLAVLYLAFLIAVAGGVPRFVQLLSAHFLLSLAALFLALSMVAQFVLPVRDSRGRRAVVSRLLNYTLGERGSVTFVKEGRAQAESGGRGPGVIWVDYLSAAVLRTDRDFTRTILPGQLAFTVPGERLAEALDLRRQRRSLQSSPPPAGSPATAQEVGAMAVTRDGIPISASLRVSFVLERRPPFKRGTIADPPPISPSAPALQAAASGRAVAGEDRLPWSDLPQRLVVELWREFVKEHPLDDFLTHPAATAAAIATQVQERLVAGTGRSVPGDETRLLRERGIQILEVAIEDPQLPEEIREERLNAWFDRWAGPVQKQLTDAETQLRAAGRRGEAETSARLLDRLTHKLRQQLRLEPAPGPRDTLILLLEDAAEYCPEDNRLAHLASPVRSVLEEVKARDPEGLPRGEG
ncbi:MAG TPA: hypothetical protein VI729_05795 [Anaerolineales bacterium]|nr:hypothetical protein [Anaerolineales bacterium]